MTKWKQAKKEWDLFLSRVALAKKAVGCQSRSAWFRGLTDNQYGLKPSILRSTISVGEIIWKLDEGRTLAQIERRPEKYASNIYKFLDQGRLSYQYAKYIESSLNTALENNGIDRQRAFSNFKGSLPGERDAFHEFFNRSGFVSQSSWTILAHMRLSLIHI